MVRAVLTWALLALSCGAARADAALVEPQPLACVPPERARAFIFDEKLVPPFRAMRQAAILSDAEAIDIQLCRFQGGFVYDVTLVDGEGRVMHRLMSALTGSPLGGRAKP